MKKMIISTMVLALTGCATTSTKQEVVYYPAQRTVITPAKIVIPSNRNHFRLAYGNDRALEQAFRQYAKTGKAPNIITDGFIKFAYNAGQQPIVKTTPLQETVISLEPGERFTNITSGDPNRWSYTVAESGIGDGKQQNILVKPAMQKLSTNMVITTDRRLYNIKLVTTSIAETTRVVSFWYPQEMVGQVNAVAVANHGTVSNTPNVNLNQINFSYKLSCSLFCRKPTWTPTQIFDDGKHTYIQFPPRVANRELPALFILEGREKALVNYRYKAPYFVVDRLFKEAILIIGTGRAKQFVKITNCRY